MSERFRPTLAQYRNLEESFKRMARRKSDAEEAFVRERTERRHLESQLQYEIDRHAETIKKAEAYERWFGGAVIVAVVSNAIWLIVIL